MSPPIPHTLHYSLLSFFQLLTLIPFPSFHAPFTHFLLFYSSSPPLFSLPLPLLSPHSLIFLLISPLILSSSSCKSSLIYPYFLLLFLPSQFSGNLLHRGRFSSSEAATHCTQTTASPYHSLSSFFPSSSSPSQFDANLLYRSCRHTVLVCCIPPTHREPPCLPPRVLPATLSPSCASPQINAILLYRRRYV